MTTPRKPKRRGPQSPRGKREKGRNAVNAVAEHYQARGYMTTRSPFEPGIDLAVIAGDGSSLMIEVKAVAHLYDLDAKDKRIIWDRAQEARRKGVGYLVVQVLGADAEWWRVDALEPSAKRNGLSLKVFSLGREVLQRSGTPREGEGNLVPLPVTTKESD